MSKKIEDLKQKEKVKNSIKEADKLLKKAFSGKSKETVGFDLGEDGKVEVPMDLIAAIGILNPVDDPKLQTDITNTLFPKQKDDQKK